MALGVIQFTTPNNGRVWFDLDSGVVGTQGSGLSGAIEEFPNGWYRCSVTFTTDAVDTTGQLYIYLCEGDNLFLNTNRDGTSDLYVWGAQLEAGSFPTSYIKTTGSTATRSADVASLPVADFGYNQSEGTVSFEANVTAEGTSKGLVSFNANGSVENIGAYRAASGNVQLEFRSSSTNQATFSLSSGSDNFKAAYTFAENDFNLAVNGTAATADTSGVIPTGITSMLVGDVYGNAGFLTNGHIKSIKYYPRRLTNAQLVDLTS